jgi:CDP-diacylglycerol---glycerol-3-phosphate 3-phosphatidyltransferase
MNFPNTLSVLRIVLSPVFMILFLTGSGPAVQISFFVFTIAALTDWYDGWYARKYGFKTKWGRFLDPLADKILTSCALLAFYLFYKAEPGFFGTNRIIPVWILIAVIILRDIILTAVRSYMELKGRGFKTSMISKTKTFLQMVYIFCVIGFFAIGLTFSGTGFGQAVRGLVFSGLNYYSLMIISILTAASGVAYIFESNSPADSLPA